jgi:hypothetical protein
MSGSGLEGVAIMVAIDDYGLALEVCNWLRLVGAEVCGPVASESEAHRLIASGRRIDGALLKCDLRDGSARSIARELDRLAIPFACVGGRPASAPAARGSVPAEPMTAYAAVSALLEQVSARSRLLVLA